MGLKSYFKKDTQRNSVLSQNSTSVKSEANEEYGNNSNIQTGWTGDGFAGANEYPNAGGEEYKTLGRWRACVILITIEVGIGVLSLPSALKTLGLIPGIITILGFGGLTTYCGYILVQFYRRYPMVTNLVDCALYVGGKPFERFLGVAFVFNLVLICASANITMSVALNTLSNHALCTVYGFPTRRLLVVVSSPEAHFRGRLQLDLHHLDRRSRVDRHDRSRRCWTSSAAWIRRQNNACRQANICRDGERLAQHRLRLRRQSIFRISYG
jgi:hypothetical protein